MILMILERLGPCQHLRLVRNIYFLRFSACSRNAIPMEVWRRIDRVPSKTFLTGRGHAETYTLHNEKYFLLAV